MQKYGFERKDSSFFQVHMTMLVIGAHRLRGGCCQQVLVVLLHIFCNGVHARQYCTQNLLFAFSLMFFDFYWYSLMFIDFYWSSLIFNDCLLIFIDFHWFSLIFIDFHWFFIDFQYILKFDKVCNIRFSKRFSLLFQVENENFIVCKKKRKNTFAEPKTPFPKLMVKPRTKSS